MRLKRFKKELKLVDPKAYKRFKKEFNRQAKGLNLKDYLKERECAYEVVISSFDWHMAKHGWNYWCPIYKRLVRQEEWL